MPDPAALQAALNSALAGVFGDEFLHKWVVLAETSGPDGSRGLWAMAAEEQKSWDTLGLLEYARCREQAALIKEQLAEEC